MIVTAIVAALAVMGFSSFDEMRRNSRRAEGKSLLVLGYSAQKAFWAEWGMYYGDFRDIGLAPEGRLRFRLGLGGGGPGLPADYNFLGGRCAALPCGGLLGELFNTGLYCPWSGQCEEVARYIRACTGIINPTANLFRMCVASNLDPDANYDEWLIDQDKLITQFQTD